MEFTRLTVPVLLHVVLHVVLPTLAPAVHLYSRFTACTTVRWSQVITPEQSKTLVTGLSLAIPRGHRQVLSAGLDDLAVLAVWL